VTNNKELSERDICTQFILPDLVKAGWDVAKQIRGEVYFTDGRIFVKGNKTVRDTLSVPYNWLADLSMVTDDAKLDLTVRT